MLPFAHSPRTTFPWYWDCQFCIQSECWIWNADFHISTIYSFIQTVSLFYKELAQENWKQWKYDKEDPHTQIHGNYSSDGKFQHFLEMHYDFYEFWRNKKKVPDTDIIYLCLCRGRKLGKIILKKMFYKSFIYLKVKGNSKIFKISN